MSNLKGYQVYLRAVAYDVNGISKDFEGTLSLMGISESTAIANAAATFIHEVVMAPDATAVIFHEVEASETLSAEEAGDEIDAIVYRWNQSQLDSDEEVS